MSDERRALITRSIAWTGLVGPAAVVVNRSGEAILEHPFAPAALIRGLGPALALLAVLALSRTSLRPLDSREWALAAYLSVVVASVIWSVAPMATLLKAGHLVIAYGLLVVLSRHWRSRADALDEIATVVYLVIGATVVGAIAVPESAFRASRLWTVWPPMHPVTVGMFAMVALVTLVAGVGPKLVRDRRWLRVVIAIIVVAVLLLTRTRSVLLLTPLALLAYLMLQGKTRVASAWVGAGAVALAAVVLSPLRHTVWTVLARGGATDQLLTLNGRLLQWSDVLQVIGQRPIQGFGYYAGRRFGPYADRFAERSGRSDTVILDGTWANTLLELGVLGVAALGIFVAISFVRISRSSGGPGTYRAAHLALLSVLVIFSVHELTLEQVGYHLVVAASIALAPARERGGRGRCAGSQLRPMSATARHVG